MSRRSLRVGVAALAASTALLVLAPNAWAHISVSADDTSAGSYARVTFNVPDESDSAATVGLKLQLPQDTPLAAVSIQPKSGWTWTVKKAKPSTPLSTDDGPVSEVVTEVDWTADRGHGIRPGEFDTFVLSVGPLPSAKQLVFKALQTYSDGHVDSWIETPAPGSSAEPEHPAPTLALASGGGAAPAATVVTRKESEAGSVWLGGGSGVIALAALGLAAVAFVRTRTPRTSEAGQRTAS